MKTKRKRHAGLAVAMTSALLISLLLAGCGQKTISTTKQEKKKSEPLVIEVDCEGAKPAGKKSEVVAAKADATGNIESISAEITLSDLTDGVNVLETTSLSDLKNTVGDEEYVLLPDGNVVFENKGKDITYKGTASEELPVSVEVTYYLNGKQTNPEQMAGASGDVKIRFDYENRTKESISVGKKTITTPTPFLTISAVAMDKDVFSDIEVTNGRLVDISGSQMVVGYALPGLADVLELNDYEMFEDKGEIPEYVEISAHTENFSLEFTETIITNQLFSSLEEEDFDKIDELSDSMSELEDASADIYDGISGLNDGINEFSGYLSSYTKGVSTLSKGITQLQSGIEMLNENKASLKTGADSLYFGLTQLQTALQSPGFDDLDTQELTEAMTGMMTDLTAISAQVTALNDSAEAINQYVSDSVTWQESVLEMVETADSSLSAIDTDDLSEDTLEKIQAARSSMASLVALSLPETPQLSVNAAALSEATDSLQEHMAVISAAKGTLTGLDESMKALQATVDQLCDGSGKLSEGMGTFHSGIEQLATGADQLADGASDISTAGPKLVKGMKQVVDGTEALKEGYKEFHEKGIKELTGTMTQDVQRLVNKIKALSEADTSYDNYSGKADDQESSVIFMIETE